MPTNNYSFVVSNSFKPFSMQEMLVPFTTYKEAFDTAEQSYADISNKADTFKYLSETLPEDSKARQLYEGYADTLSSAAEDLARNGLTMGNRRTLTDLKRRYAGEIGRLQKADDEMQKELEIRRQMSAKDPTQLYAQDNLSIDAFLDRKKPDLYSVSGNDLYKMGAQAGQSASSRMYQNTQINDLNKYYQETIQRMGYDPALLAQWRTDLEAIPEFNQAVNDILKAQGVSDHLTGINYERAKQNVINGMMDGAIYKEARNTVQNQGVLTAAQAAQNARALDSLNLQAASAGMKRDATSPTGWTWDQNIDPAFQKAKATAEIKSQNRGTNGGSSTSRRSQMKNGLRITWNGNEPSASEKALNDRTETSYHLTGSEDIEHKGKLTSYDDLPQYAKDQVDKVIKDGNFEDYDIYFQPFVHGTIDDTEAVLEVEPREFVTGSADDLNASLFNLNSRE